MGFDRVWFTRPRRFGKSLWRFSFITGITRFSHTGIFSGLNNLTDITLDPRFSTLVGYTEAELRRYFGDHLQSAANAHHMDVEH